MPDALNLISSAFRSNFIWITMDYLVCKGQKFILSGSYMLALCFIIVFWIVWYFNVHDIYM